MAIVDVIKWEVDPLELVYKFPINDLKLGSQLVVYPNQTAFFIKGGQIFDEFTSGTYSIKSENIPLLNKLINKPFGNDSPFQAEVWFVNQITLLDCKWGTASPIQIEDPKYGVIVPIRAYGQYGIKIEKPRVFLETLIGNMPRFSTEQVKSYFKGVILSKLTSIISQKLYDDNLSVVNINSYVEEISQFAEYRLKEVFDKYGISIELFTAFAINVDEDDSSFQNLKETKDSLARINIMGKENYQMDRSFNVLESAAENEGNGIIGAAVGIGAGVGIGSQIGPMINQHLNTNPQTTPPGLPVISYYLGINGHQQGPFPFESIKEMLTEHRIDENTLIWKRGMTNWSRIADINDFNDCLGGPPPLPQ